MVSKNITIFENFFRQILEVGENLEGKCHESAKSKSLMVRMLNNSLVAMQEVVGGYIDIVGLDDNVCIPLNDEGILIGLENNRSVAIDIIVGVFCLRQ